MAYDHSTPQRRISKTTKYRTHNVKVRRLFKSRLIQDKVHWAHNKTVTKQVPWISLQGQWLANVGFTFDSKVSIEVEDGKLTLTLKDTPTLSS